MMRRASSDTGRSADTAVSAEVAVVIGRTSELEHATIEDVAAAKKNIRDRRRKTPPPTNVSSAIAHAPKPARSAPGDSPPTLHPPESAVAAPTHTFASLQVVPPTQSSLVAQRSTHAPALHANGAHGVVVPSGFCTAGPSVVQLPAFFVHLPPFHAYPSMQS